VFVLYDLSVCVASLRTESSDGPEVAMGFSEGKRREKRCFRTPGQTEESIEVVVEAKRTRREEDKTSEQVRTRGRTGELSLAFTLSFQTTATRPKP
jgi:hypothetical protein